MPDAEVAAPRPVARKRSALVVGSAHRPGRVVGRVRTARRASGRGAGRHPSRAASLTKADAPAAQPPARQRGLEAGPGRCQPSRSLTARRRRTHTSAHIRLRRPAKHRRPSPSTGCGTHVPQTRTPPSAACVPPPAGARLRQRRPTTTGDKIHPRNQRNAKRTYRVMVATPIHQWPATIS